jgi:hypothetical protein
MPCQKQITKTKKVESRKEYLIFKLGGRCSVVGCPVVYDGHNACIFDFHHQIPLANCEKKFGITNWALDNYSMEEIEAEVAKCLLVCRNCHNEIHYRKGRGNWFNFNKKETEIESRGKKLAFLGKNLGKKFRIVDFDERK